MRTSISWLEARFHAARALSHSPVHRHRAAVAIMPKKGITEMPVPGFQPVKKKSKVTSPSLDDLDDYCLSRIISHALTLAASSDKDDSTLCDNGETERCLSLVSKRWYFLTQTQIDQHGVHKINLDKIPVTSLRAPRPTGTLSLKKPEVLSQRNFGLTRPMPAIQPLSKPASDLQDLRLFRHILPKLRKYRLIILEGTIEIETFLQILAVLNAARTEKLILKLKIISARSQLAKFTTRLPEQMPYLEELTLYWSNDLKNTHSNGLIWTIFDKATRLNKLRIYVNDEIVDNSIKIQSSVKDSIEQICTNFIKSHSSRGFQGLNSHSNLESITFNRSSSNISPNCRYTTLLRNLLMREESVNQVDTNDGVLIEHLIKSSDRICTTRELRSLRILAPIKNFDLLAQLLRSKSLGTQSLSIIIDTIDHIEEVRLNMENFKLNRHESASSQISLYMKDQKFPDCEEKIKSLVSLSRLADIVVYVSAQQRISIDCCHLMWSVGRSLQSHNLPGRCLFKILLQTGISKNTQNQVEITVPIGKCSQYTINSNREDATRHREIMKALKKDCYHQFVKSIRDQITP